MHNTYEWMNEWTSACNAIWCVSALFCIFVAFFFCSFFCAIEIGYNLTKLLSWFSIPFIVNKFPTPNPNIQTTIQLPIIHYPNPIPCTETYLPIQNTQPSTRRYPGFNHIHFILFSFSGWCDCLFRHMNNSLILVPFSLFSVLHSLFVNLNRRFVNIIMLTVCCAVLCASIRCCVWYFLLFVI